jgi:hypothetical protein
MYIYIYVKPIHIYTYIYVKTYIHILISSTSSGSGDPPFVSPKAELVERGFLARNAGWGLSMDEYHRNHRD